MAFQCDYCPKVLSRSDHLKSHIKRYHTDKSNALSFAPKVGSSCPDHLDQRSAPLSDDEVDGFKDSESDTSSTTTQNDMKRKVWDIFQEEDSESVDEQEESVESGESDMDDDKEEDDASSLSGGEDDPDWVFNFLIYHAKINLRKESGGDYGLKELRKRFRQNYANIIKWFNALRQNTIHKKIVSQARELRDNYDYDYDEAIDSAISKRKFLLNRIVTEADLTDEEEEHDTDTD